LKNKNKVCLLVDGFDVPRWVYHCIDNINNSDHSEVVLCLKNKTADYNHNKKLSIFSRLLRIIKHRRNFFYYLYIKIDNYIFSKFTTLFQIDNFKKLLTCDVIEISPIKTKFSDRFDPETIEKIKEYDLDVILRFGFRILRGSILTECSKFGVWSFHGADYKVNRGGPASFWEFLENNPYTGITFQILNEELDNGRILYQTYSSTNKSSVIINRENSYNNIPKICDRVLKELFDCTADEFDQRISRRNPSNIFYYNPLYKTPSNTTIIVKLCKKIITGLIKKISNKFYFNQWSLSYSINNNNESYSSSLYRYKKISPPKDRYWADPFVIKKDSMYYIYFEEVLLDNDKGRICYIELDEKGKISESKIALETDFHLSYPFIIEDKNELYMIPETMEQNTIELYKCTNFPNRWELAHVMMKDVQAVDSTIFKYKGKYWMFCNLKSHSNFSINEELYLFFSESLHGEWISHPLNPIISDIRNSRPAGNIIKVDGKIYRPSQDSSIRYGHSININEIIKISESEYEEKTVEYILPKWSKEIWGVHTVNSDKDITVIDCLTRRRKIF